MAYPFMQPHQRNVTNLLATAVQACHDMVCMWSFFAIFLSILFPSFFRVRSWPFMSCNLDILFLHHPIRMDSPFFLITFFTCCVGTSWLLMQLNRYLNRLWISLYMIVRVQRYCFIVLAGSVDSSEYHELLIWCTCCDSIGVSFF